MKRLLLLLACLASVFVANLGLSQPALASNQFLSWDDAGGTTFATFGPNASITINTGKLEWACDSFLYASNIYVVPTGSVSAGSTLTDVSGTPNTVQTAASGGLFIDETIGFTAPGGKIGPGEYAVVYDECQNGKFDAQMDALFDPAFRVEIPADVPNLSNAEISKIKADAQVQAQKSRDAAKFFVALSILYNVASLLPGTEYPYHALISMYLNFACPFIPSNPDLGIEWYCPTVSLHDVIKLQAAATKVLLDEGAHWQGIAADPPDPNFQNPAVLGPRTEFQPETSDPVEVALVAFAQRATVKEASSATLLASMEKYQGAAADDDGVAALMHARNIKRDALLLADNMAPTNASIDQLLVELKASPRDLEGLSDQLKLEQDQVKASGLGSDEIRHLKNLGLTDDDIAMVEKRMEYAPFTTFRDLGGIDPFLTSLKTTNSATATSLRDLASAMDSNIASLVDQGFDVTPVPDAGGPYTSAEDTSIAFDASSSTDPQGKTLTYAWDLDGDAQFDDATGARPTHTYTAAFADQVGVKVTNSEGRFNVAYSSIEVTETNQPPKITTVSPATTEEVAVEMGSSRTLTAAAADPDGDPVTLTWLINGYEAGTGESFTFGATEDNAGVNSVAVKASDGQTTGGSTTRRWLVESLHPDADDDGWRANADCDDSDPSVNPGKTEVLGNGKNDDCNGATLDRPSIAVVTKIEDTNDGACDSDCSLREAITHANSHPNAAELDKITFNIPGEGVKTISPTSALPEITDPVVIDGYTQPGASENTRAVGNDAVLEIELNGSKVGGTVDGLTITAGNSTIHGLVIGGYKSAGIAVKSKGNNIVEGNYIGTNAAGTASSATLGNNVGVLIIGGSANTIGGTSAAARNIISGNSYLGPGRATSYSYGVLIRGTHVMGNKIQGNYIGTDKNGTADLGNAYMGVTVMNSSGNTIGGTAAGARNIISGNGFEGIEIRGDPFQSVFPTDNQVQGNYIGTDVTGTKVLGNGEEGVHILFGAQDTTVGGTTSEARNVISGNGYGVMIETSDTTGNAVQGNYIGTDVTGTKVLGNYSHGVRISQSPNNIVGGTAPGAGNVISGNGSTSYSSGVWLSGPKARANRIEGNYIGTDKSGTEDLGNTSNGVFIQGADNFVGGTAPGAGNVIAFNYFDGVQVFEGGQGTTILSNSIFENGEPGRETTAPHNDVDLGIDLVPVNYVDGVTANDGDDPATSQSDPDKDAGPNGLQNYPAGVTAKRDNAGNTKIRGTLESTPNTNFTVQYFANPKANPSGYGEGKKFLGQMTDVQTNGSGKAAFAFDTLDALLGEFVSATATNQATNDTSEFSAAVEVVPDDTAPANSAPIANNQKITIEEDAPSELITLSATDADKDDLAHEITALPTNGKLYEGENTAEDHRITGAGANLSGNIVTYVPNGNFNGDDSFGFLANDGTEDSNAATVSIGVTAVNDAPTVVLTGPDAASEGDFVTYSFSVSDPDTGDTFDLKGGFPDCGAGGTQVNGSLTTFASGGSFDCRFAGGQANTDVRVQVTDSQGADSNVATKNVTVANAKPVVVAPTDGFGVEGTGKSFALGSFSDAGANDGPWKVSVDWGDGSPVESLTDMSPQGSLGNASHTYDDNGTYTVSVSVTDKDDDTGSATFKATVANVDPTATLGNNGPISEGGSATVAFSNSSDPSGADTTAGFHYAFRCDGSAFATAPTYSGSGASASTTCQFNDDTGGPFAIRARIIDKDGGYTEKTTNIAVTNAAPKITSFTSTPYFYGPLSFLGNTPNASKFSGAWTDPGADTWTALLTYPDGNPLTQTLSPLTMRSFSDVGHTFASAGCKSTSLNVSDGDGGSDSATTTTVVGTGAFMPPMTNQPVTDKLKNGQVLPVKVKFTDCNGAPLANLTPAIRLVRGDQTPTSDDSTDTITPGSVSAADTLGIMRSNGDGSYIYNMSINLSKLNTDHTVVVYPYGTDDPRRLGHVIQATK